MTLISIAITLAIIFIAAKKTNRLQRGATIEEFMVDFAAIWTIAIVFILATWFVGLLFWLGTEAAL